MALLNGNNRSWSVNANIANSVRGSALMHHAQDSRGTIDTDIFCSMKKKWTRFWNEPEHISVADSSSHTVKDGLE